jgi:RHS repeat-associated protein
VTLGYTSRLRTSLTLAQPTIGNWTHSYTWDNARRLDTVTGSSGSFDYDYIAAATSGDYASRLVKKLTVPTTSAGPNITNLWDTTGRLTETKLVNGGTTFNRHAYVLNAAHQRTKQTRPDSTYVDYTYDDAGQLNTALSYYSGGSSITTEQLKYGYDAAQNLTKRTNNTTVTSYTVNSLNQITADGGASWTHDHNGNRTYQPNGVGSYNYTYDDENQLVAAQTDTSSTSTGSRGKTLWTYDARGRVRVREDYGWYAPGSYFLLSKTTRYLYDGMRVIQERNASNVPQVTYTRGLDLAGSWERAGGIGGLLARTAHSGANGVTYTPAFYHADGNGNVTYLLKLDQTMGASYTFDPYGRQLASSGTLANANTYRFSSKELMLSSGLYYYGYRFYDPNTQRWLNRDPLGDVGFDMRNGVLNFEGNQPNRRLSSQSVFIIEQWEGGNLYGFVYNSPVSWVDVHGLYTAKECMGIGGAFFSGAAEGLAAEVDGALPFVDPFARAGAYDPNDPNLQASQTCGAIATCAVGGAGALRGGAYLGATRTGLGRWLNHGRNWRIGPGNIPKGKPFTCGPGQNVPTLRIGNGKPAWWNHFDLRAWGH